jgi:hypothetical protein
VCLFVTVIIQIKQLLYNIRLSTFLGASSTGGLATLAGFSALAGFSPVFSTFFPCFSTFSTFPPTGYFFGYLESD